MSDEFETEAEMSEDKMENTEMSHETEDPKEAPPAVEFERSVTPDPNTGLAGPSLASVIDVPLRVNVEIGSAKMLVREVLQLNKGSVVPLDRMSGDPADILVNGRLIARGEVTVLDDSLAVRVVELVGREQNGGAR